MKKLFLVTFLFCLIVILALSGCGGGGGGSSKHAQVTVQLVKASDNTTHYAVDKMRVYIQKNGGGSLLSGVTDVNGQASISVSTTGTYNIVKVKGLNAATLTPGSEGREFIKSGILADAEPELSHSYSAPFPNVNVTTLGNGTVYPVDAPVSAIQKVTFLKTESVDVFNPPTPPGTLFGTFESGYAGVFSGRVIIKNIVFGTSARIIFNSSNTLQGLQFYINQTNITGQVYYDVTGTSFIGAPFGSFTNYTYEGPVRFEISGLGDWALDRDTPFQLIQTRQTLINDGNLSANVSFDQFKSTGFLSVYNDAIDNTHHLQFLFEAYKFDTSTFPY